MERRCLRCAAVVAAGEQFCAACGVPIGGGTRRATTVGFPGISTARKWLLAVAILTLGTGLVYYALQHHTVEKQVREAIELTQGMDDQARDEMYLDRVGMTFRQAIHHDRGQVRLFLAINIGLAAIYLGLFFWGRSNELGACVIALLLFVTVMAINAVIEPSTLWQGIPVKIFFIAALVRAIVAAQQERRLAA